MDKKTWWTFKYIDPTLNSQFEVAARSAFADKDIAEREALCFRRLGAANVRVVPCDPPVLRHPIKSSNKGKP